MAGTISLRRGETLQATFALQQDDGTPIDTSAATLTGRISDALGAPVAVPSFVPQTGIDGAYSIEAGDTSTWPTGPLVCTTTLTLNGATTISDALTILVTG